MPSRMKQNRFTLVDTLVYMAVFVTVSSCFLTFYHNMVKVNRHAMRQNHRHQECRVIHKRWQEWVSETDQFGWAATKSAFKCEPVRVSQKDNLLLWENGGDQLEQTLPHDCEVSFAIERWKTQRVAVMTLSFKAQPGFRPEAVRLTAVSRK